MILSHAMVPKQMVCTVPEDSSITSAVAEAIRLSKSADEFLRTGKGALVSFMLQGVIVRVQADSDPAFIERKWRYISESHCSGLAIGPYDAPMPTSVRERLAELRERTAPYRTDTPMREVTGL